MNYLPNDRNLVRDAALSATNIAPSRVYYRIDEAEKAGGGTVALAGDYTGDSSITVDVEVLDEGGSDRAVSTPTFAGTGSGTMTAVTADATVDAQEFVVTLKDLGTLTRAARTPFQGSAVVARLPGAGGNDIRITVDQSGIVAVLSPDFRYSLQADVQAGVNEYTGAHLWNFRTPYLNADGTVPDESPRIRFGDDPQVYRPYKRRVGQQDVFSFSPAPVRNAEAGTPLKLVTGTYSITVTDGVTPQVLSGIVTVYDALVALQNATLVTVEGVGPIHDRAPGGQAAVDFSLWTQPYVASISREGTTYVEEAALTITAGAYAPAETLSIECIDVSVAGSERWRVRGDVSQTLAQAITGILYAAGGYSFTIPRPSAADEGVVGEIDVSYSRPSGGGVLPNFKSVRAVLGIGARNGTWVFEWQPRPEVCDEVGEVVGGPIADCLGLVPEGDDLMATPLVMRRLQKLAEFRHKFSVSNTAIPPLGQQVTVGDDGTTVLDTLYSSVAEQDLAYINKASAVLGQCLRRLGEQDADTSFAPWAANAAHEIGDVIQGSVSGVLYRFVATTAGSSSATEPTWTASLDATYTDGGVVWENRGRLPLDLWDELFELLKTDAQTLMGITVMEPAFFWSDGAALQVGQAVMTSNYGVARVTTAGTTGATLPQWPDAIGATIADGGVVWTIVSRDSYRAAGNGQRPIPDAWYQRYSSGADAVITAAGIDPGFDGASIQSGDGCWQDIPEADWYFACITPDAKYAHVFPNLYYHASIKKTLESGAEVYESTKEFAFGAAIGCLELIAPGDLITVTIRNVNGVSTYQQGDRFDAQIVRAEPLGLAGGQTGSDTLTWSVIGGVAGALPDYALALTAPVPYSADGVGFTIAPGAVPFELGAQFRFSVQAARGQWRIDGGGWSPAFAIGPAGATLADGLSVLFADGVAPSWVPGDRWTFAVEATNGVDQIRAPTDARAAWTGSTVIEIAGGPIEGVMLGDHTIPSDATVTLTGSDDGFATTALTVVLPWHRGSMWRAVTADHGAYRLSINRGGSLSWLWLGDPLQLELRTGVAELGALTLRYRLPGATRRAGFGVTAVHEGVSQTSFNEWMASIEGACTVDDRRIGIVPTETLPQSAIVTVDVDSLDVADVLRFQPTEPAHRLLSFNIDLAPVA